MSPERSLTGRPVLGNVASVATPDIGTPSAFADANPTREEPSNRQRRRLLALTLQGLLLVSLAFGSYCFASRFIATSVRVVGNSMFPTLRDKDRYLLNRWIYVFRAPREGEIVVISDPADNRLSVKRVVAVPGQTVLVKPDGKVFRDGQELHEPYLPTGMVTYPIGTKTEQVLVCGANDFVLLGDNRMNSADSRVYGTVQRKRILGMIVR